MKTSRASHLDAPQDNGEERSKAYRNTLNEYRSRQHSGALRAPAEFLALPESRPMRCVD